jgi:hypothetical protein
MPYLGRPVSLKVVFTVFVFTVLEMGEKMFGFRELLLKLNIKTSAITNTNNAIPYFNSDA